jgi:hypothetical protein
LLSQLIPTLFWALFSLILPRDPNGEGHLRKHLFDRSSEMSSAEFFIMLHRCKYERTVSPFCSACRT